MPCSDGYPSDSHLRIADLKTTNLKLEVTCRRLEAMLCAVISQIRSQDNFSNIIDNAETNGDIGIWTFIEQHNKKDKERIKEKLESTFSKHELDLVLEILDKNELQEEENER